MRRSSIIAIVLCLGIGITTCKNESYSNAVNEREGKAETQEGKHMVTIIEIPVTNMTRAVKFYQGLLGVTIETITMEGTELGVFPSKVGTVSVVLVKGDDYLPAKNGTLVYLNPGDDLQPALDRVEKNGGKVILTKTQISPEMGYYAFFIDSEGNKLGLHSQK